MMIQRSFPNILSTDLDAALAFYKDFLGFEITFMSQWFINLRAHSSEALELGLIARDHDLVPTSVRTRPTGMMLTLEIKDVDTLHTQALEQGIEVVEPPRNLFYGQRRMILADPDGTLIDISSPCPPDPAWMARVQQTEDGGYIEHPPEDPASE